LRPEAADAAWLLPAWPAPKSIHALTTTRQLPGNSLPPFDAFNLGLRSGEDSGIVLANRALLGRACALPSPPRWLRQVHGNRSLRLTAEVLDEELEADAAFTTQPGVVLAILTADCLPILICADDGTEIAALHAGWRGLANGVIESCIGRLRTAPEKLLAWLGPAIGAASYEVGDEVRDAFVTQAPATAVAFAATRAGHWRCDLYTLARLRLAALGVGHVHGGGFDTFTDARFYSYRRDGQRSGRFASLIWIGA
jgi:YfiH family protein